MRWVTRKDVRAGRIACAWLIRRFLDPEVEFLFVEEKDVLSAAASEDAVPFDLPHHPELKFNPHEGLSTFEVLAGEFDLEDPALKRLGRIVHAAELRGTGRGAAESAGVKAIVEGFQRMGASDEKRLAWSYPIFDALYAWCEKRAK